MQITTSPNVSNLDFSVLVDTSGAIPVATVTDISTFIGAGATNIIGFALKMVDPNNLTFHETIYPPNVDINTGLGSFSKNMPYFNGGVVQGTYKFYVTLIDQDGTQYVWTENGVTYKTVFVCKPNSLQMATGNWGGLLLDVNFDCDLGQLIVQDGGTGFSYAGKTPSNTDVALTITYPVDSTGTVIAPVASFIPFILPITLTGTYTIQGKVIQTYQLSATTSIKVAYYYYKTFDVQCKYSLCKALCDYERIIAEVKSCSFGRNVPSISSSLDKLKQLALFTAEIVKVKFFKDCGKDFGNILETIQQIGDFSCECDCAPTGIAPAPMVMSGGTLVVGNMCGDIDLTLTKFGNNIQINANDITYDIKAVGTYAANVTITPKLDVCKKTFEIDIDFNTALAALDICISNTLFVTPCGNDLTAQVGNFLKPYKTIKAAVKAATSNSGQTIWVWAGTYLETLINFGSDAVEKTGVDYYFNEGAVVTATGDHLWSFAAISGVTNIGGYGRFSSDHSVFRNTVAATTTLNLKGQSIAATGSTGHGIAVQSGTYHIEVDTITAAGESCLDVRVGTTTGYLSANLMDNQNNVLSSPTAKFTSGGTHKWECYVKKAKSTSNASANSATVFLVAVPNSHVHWVGDVENNCQSSGTGFTCGVGIGNGAGYLLFEGDIDCTGNDGIHGVVHTAGFLTINHSRIRVSGNSAALLAANPSGDGITTLNNCQLVNNASGVATILFNAGAATSRVQLNSCVVVNEDSSGGSVGITITNASQQLRMKNTWIVVGNGSAGTSINASVNINTIITDSYSNRATGGGGVITDLVEPLNIDADLFWNVY